MARLILLFLSIPIALMGLFVLISILPIFLGGYVMFAILSLFVILSIYLFKKILFDNDKILWYRNSKQIALIIACIVFYGYVSAKLFYRSGNFRFDDFKTQEQAQAYFDEYYPKGSDANKLLKDVTKVGGDCYETSKAQMGNQAPIEKFRYDKMCGCRYYNWFFSFDPLQRFAITIYTDKNDQVIKTYVAKHYMWG